MMAEYEMRERRSALTLSASLLSRAGTQTSLIGKRPLRQPLDEL